MIYNEKHIFIVYIVVIVSIIILISLMFFVNIGDMLHSYNPNRTIAAYWGVKPPNGWVICDGSNGTPDLRGKFLYGGNAFSQYLLNFYPIVNNRNFINHLESIEGGKNYQTLTERVENLDLYELTRPSIGLNFNFVDIIDNNNNILSTHNDSDFSLDIVNNMVDDDNIVDKFDKVLDYLPNEIYSIAQLDTNTLHTAENQRREDRIENVKNEIMNEKNDNKEEGEDDIIINQITNDNPDITDADIEDAESNVQVIFQPNYGRYKFPAHKSLNADMNLPPLYALIYIMKK